MSSADTAGTPWPVPVAACAFLSVMAVNLYAAFTASAALVRQVAKNDPGDGDSLLFSLPIAGAGLAGIFLLDLIMLAVVIIAFTARGWTRWLFSLTAFAALLSLPPLALVTPICAGYMFAALIVAALLPFHPEAAQWFKRR